MKRFAWMALAVLLTAACQKQGAVTPSLPEARVEGTAITFADKAPQLANISIEAAQPCKASGVVVFGRLAWDEERTARIYAPVAGRVTEISTPLGREVQADDVLAVLASPDYGQAQSDVRKASGDLAFSEKTLARMRELLDHGAAAEKDVEAAQADHNRAVAEVQRAEAQLLALSKGQTDAVDGVYRLRSPIRGVVVDRNLTPGQLIRPDLVLANAPQFTLPQFTVTDPTRLWLFLDVTDADTVAFHPGQEVRFTTPAYPDRTFAGRLDFIGQALDPATRTVKARAVVDNPDRILKAEMYVTAEVIGARTAGVDVSAKAVFMKENQYQVFVETAPGTFARQPVQVGAENGGRIAIVGGLSPGQRVVAEGSLLLQALLEGGGNP